MASTTAGLAQQPLWLKHLVVPGQVIVVASRSNESSCGGGGGSQNADDHDKNNEPNRNDSSGNDTSTTPPPTTTTTSFLRGHGTYLENRRNPRTGEWEQCLMASVVGTVERVNQLISVASLSLSHYDAHVGDLIVGRIVAVQPAQARWKVALLGSNNNSSSSSRPAILPLSGVYLPGGAQRVRTAQDARDMRDYLLMEGDLVSAEVHKVSPGDGSVMLHTRSARYGKLQAGCLVQVPPALIVRRKHHMTTCWHDQYWVLWGCNGHIWLQRNYSKSHAPTTDLVPSSAHDLHEEQEERKLQHANMPYTIQERQDLARLRNSMECLRRTLTPLTVEAVEQVMQTSLDFGLSISQMLEPDNVIRLTASHRS